MFDRVSCVLPFSLKKIIQMKQRIRCTALFTLVVLLLSSCNNQKGKNMDELLVIKEQGSFAVGGTVIQNTGKFDNYQFDNFKVFPEGQSYHGDHAYIFYQIPDEARKLPLVFLHGYGQSAKTWETTPDGREGFQNIFLRRKFPVYLVDQPRRGKAGKSMIKATISPATDEQMWFDIFRNGMWPDFNPGVQFPQDEESINQFFRQQVPSIGPFDSKLVAETMAQAFDKSRK